LLFWAEHCAWILNEDKVAVKLKARPWQARTSTPASRSTRRWRSAAGQPMRAIILKARKLGFSTWVQAKFMQRVTQQPFQYAIVAAHPQVGGHPRGHGALMYDRLPTDQELGLGFSIRPHR
jgi:hypothetical protein